MRLTFTTAAGVPFDYSLPLFWSFSHLTALHLLERVLLFLRRQALSVTNYCRFDFKIIRMRRHFRHLLGECTSEAAEHYLVGRLVPRERSLSNSKSRAVSVTFG